MKVFKTAVLLIVIVLMIGLWAWMQRSDQSIQSISETEQLRQKIQDQQDQISYMERLVKQKSEVQAESSNRGIEEAVRIFVQALYNVNKETISQRSASVKQILTAELHKKYFPAEQENGEHLLFEHSLGDVRIYIKEKGENASAIAVFEQTVKTLATNQKDKYRVAIEVFLQKDNDEWKINKFNQLATQPL
ncbi:hypothetical protein ERICIV_04605 (plasmid) [Paenibacillus larvae subsp. larvae]|uniref:MerR family transcriptional regulator n=1 Tax=Paenibacillus larvae subsp. larvae TaxID=147375 RepID=A0A2L1U7S3_9BACL|nr:hypothetical protein [Paenibacillus larvae]AQT87026.1 hypothetical protein B1222_23635 [Paenibacillus larvae subsp. pulvifaciens]AQZ49342.1 hypothetical protein B5S25_22835 [Paenibacillus larvae subsp. pulvifaciens]AVF28987.1 hypothetical protein ERICIII_04986 [Paenibacillus larvae subsp. larvae]AVF33368.1 hypothetical protein ERICIV_04605 [Paenibacillus larvae subsp. larvae]MBH0342396.1 hypothetical protein [Paenibacillus larvae]